MKQTPFQAGGPLPAHSTAYVRREADEKASVALQRMEYVSLIEPREQGKTSLIGRLKDQLTPQGYIFALRDLMAARSRARSKEEWYTSLGKWLLYQLDFLPPAYQPSLPIDSA